MSLALMQALLGSRFLITPRTGEHQESKRRQVNGRCQAPSPRRYSPRPPPHSIPTTAFRRTPGALKPGTFLFWNQ